MVDNLQDAYTAYQQALHYLRDLQVCPLLCVPGPSAITDIWQEPKLWYGIGILYDRYGSLDHAEEAFSRVMGMQPDFEKANEIYFRLGIIYKQQAKFQQSLEVRRLGRLFSKMDFVDGHDLVLQVYCSRSSATAE